MYVLLRLHFSPLGGGLSAQSASNPAEDGQWSGPYELSVIDNASFAEISQAIVLPPAEGKDSRVFFMARRLECVGDGQVEGYAWRADRPGVAYKVVDPFSPIDSSESPFCSGHTLLPDGTALIAGGLDRVKKCNSPVCNPGQNAYGHTAMRLLDTTTHPPTWSTAPPLRMNRERWYPSVISLADGGLFVAGHGLAAEPDGPGQCPPVYGPEAIHETWDRMTWNTGLLSAPALTISRNFEATCSSTAPFVSVAAYPRLHLLSSGELFMSNASRAQFLDLVTPACVTEERWEVNAASMPSVIRKGGNSVHYVLPDTAGPGETVDLIYAIGGTDGGDAVKCVPVGVDVTVFPDVDKYVAPGLTTFWDSSAPDLNIQRFNHNSILLLDGSILVNGGSNGDDTPDEGDEYTCEDALPPERYRPPELFGAAGITQSWKLLDAAEGHKRRYHSVAGLLPDGRVFSAGGNADQFTYHSVSVYEPSYFFHPRPEITSSPASIGYGGTFGIDVTLSANDNTVARVALVRTGSITHAWDMNQRYVVLETGVPAGVAPHLTVPVTAPADGYVAPPGYYFLTVVENVGSAIGGEAKWIPSEGVWIHIE